MPIKLIAADMDGTLLDSAKRLPDRLFPLIRALRARGVRFAPASGRQYYTLYEQFGEIADELIYISENGAMVCDGAEVISFEAMPVDEVCRAVETVRALPGVSTVVSTRTGGVYEDGDDPAFRENMALYCARHKSVPDLAAYVRYEPVCKVALFCQGRAEQVLMPAFESFAETSQIALSGADWVDLMRPGISKGRALGVLGAQLGIEQQECMAFGDYLNDLELLQAVGESYAMANAHEALKAVAKYICPSNDEDGVCRTIRQVFGLDKQ
nr:Cof-type HAD-IIB family hydrolase [uncultured Agathobaculum sp.]